MINDHRIVAVAYDGLCTFEFGLTVEVFGLARPELAGRPWYEFGVAAAEPGPLRAAGGITVTADAGLELLDDADTIVVPGWRDAREPVPVPIVTALTAAVHRGARVLTICSGAFVVAATGLLDGHRATTHWRYAELFREKFPTVQLDPSVLFVESGPDNHILTSAGSAAGLDACLHLVRRDHGVEVANTVARRLVVAPQRSGGQAQFIPQPVAAATDDALGPVLDWATDNLVEPLTVDDLAARALMAPRTFARRFHEQTGTTPHAWLVSQRLAAACHQLEQTEHTVDDVARTTGFGSPETLRHHFRKAMHTSPTAYRRRFRAAS